VLVIPYIGARLAQRRDDGAAEGVVLVAVAHKDAQLLGHVPLLSPCCADDWQCRLPDSL
jgi:hypothetical protein